MMTENGRPKNILKYPHLLSTGKRALKPKYNERKKIKSFLIILLKLVFFVDIE